MENQAKLRFIFEGDKVEDYQVNQNEIFRLVVHPEMVLKEFIYQGPSYLE